MRRKIVLAFTCIVFAIAILIAFLPFMISSKYFRDSLVLPVVGKSLGGTISLKDASFSWMGPQRMEGVLFEEPKRNLIVEAKQVDLAVPFWDLFQRKPKEVEANIKELSFQLKDSPLPINMSMPVIDITPHGFHVGGIIVNGDSTGEILVDGTYHIQDQRLFLDSLEANIHQLPTRLLDAISLTDLPSFWQEALGSTVDVTVKNRQEADQTVFLLNAYAERFATAMKFDWRNGFVLKEPGVVEWQLSKGLFSLLNQEAFSSPFFVENQNATVRFEIPEFSTGDHNSLFDTQFQVNFLAEPIKLIDGSVIADLQGKMLKNSDEWNMIIDHISAAIRKGKFQGLIKASGIYHMRSKAITFISDGKGVPIETLGEIGGKGLPLLSLLGPTFDYSGEIEGSVNLFNGVLRVHTPLLDIPEIEFTVGKRLILRSEAKGSYLLTQNALNHLKAWMPVKLKAEQKMLLSLEDLQLPLKVSDWEPEKIVLKGTIFAEEVIVEEPKVLILEQLSAGITGANLSAATVAFSGHFSHHELPFFGEPQSSFSINMEPELEKDWTVSYIESETHFLSSESQMVTSSSYDPQSKRVSLRAKGDLLITPEVWQSYLSPYTSSLQIIAPSLMHVDISDLVFKWGWNWWETVVTEGNLSIPEVKFYANKILLASLQKLDLPWSINGAKQKAVASLSARSFHGSLNKPGTVKAEITALNWLQGGRFDLKDTIITSHARLDSFPNALFNSFLQSENLEEILGNSLDLELDAKMDFRQGYTGSSQIKLTGNGLSLEGELALGREVRLKDPAKPLLAQWNLTPNRFAWLLKNAPDMFKEANLELTETATVQFQISDLVLPWVSKVEGVRLTLAPFLGFDLASFKANAYIKSLRLVDQKRGPFSDLENINLRFSTPSFFSLWDVQGNLNADNSPNSLIKFTLAIDNPFELSSNRQNVSSTIHAEMSNFPWKTLAYLTGVSSYHATIFGASIGDSLNGNVDAKIESSSGPLDISVSGANGRMDFSGQVVNGEVLELKKPLTAEVNVNPRLAEVVLKKLAPLFSDALQAEAPIRLSIGNQGAYIPLNNLRLASLNLPNIQLDLGKILFKNEGTVGQILRVFSSSANQSGAIVVWFTPVHAELQGGVLQIMRTDLLLSQAYPLAFWGKADFNKNKLSMVVGIGADTLRRAFGAKELPDDYMLQLPLKGTIDNAQIDKTKATSKITALVAQSQGGAKGLIVGGLLDLVNGGGGNSKPTPPPTTNPLPWQGQLEAYHNKQTESKMPMPFNIIENGAKKILEKLSPF